jgi:hypothetical protein
MPHASRAKSLERDQARVFTFLNGTSDAPVSRDLFRFLPMCRGKRKVLQAKRQEGVVEVGWVLEVHVVPGRAGLAVSALQEHDILSDARGDGGGETSLANGYPRKTAGVCPS